MKPNMTDMDRRRLLSSVASSALCGSIASTVKAARAATQQSAIDTDDVSADAWLLARQCQQHQSDQGVDFWARPWCSIPYAKYLPREIPRGAMWYENSGRHRSRTAESIDRSFKNFCSDRSNLRRKIVAHIGGTESLASALRSLIEDQASHAAARTAFLSLNSWWADSIGPYREPVWADVLPAFRSCYDHIIGHFHLPQRGLRQWRQFLNSRFGSKREGGYFREFFTAAAMQCDAVILTSSALAESDLCCCSSDSTEELVGKQMQHLSCALLTPAVLERLVGPVENGLFRKPRFFALATLTLATMDDYYIYADLLIRRQAELVRGSFGEGILERSLLVVTAAEDLHSDLVGELRQAAGGSFLTATRRAYEIEKRNSLLNLLQMITLWPFEFDEDKLRSYA